MQRTGRFPGRYRGAVQGQPTTSPIAEALERLTALLARFGTWLSGKPFWGLYLAACVVVVAKTGFKWAGTTGEGWFLEFREIIDAWPLKEPIGDGASAWQENYSSIVLFKAVTRLGLPYTSATWQAVHLVATVLVVVLVGLWIRRLYGDAHGRLVAIVVLFGAAPIILLQEIGRYDSLFFLGAFVVATARRWWWIAVGALVLGTSSWAMSIGFVLSLLLAGLVLRSRTLLLRSLAAFLGAVAGIGLLMLARISQGGDPWPVRLGDAGAAGAGDNLRHFVIQGWLNIVQPFPNWIWAAYGLTWLLVVLVLLQVPGRRRWWLLPAMLLFPVAAGTLNAGDGTREIAFTLAAILFAVASVTQGRAERSGLVDRQRGPAAVLLGAVAVAALVVPVVDINPNAPLNPYGWLSDYGLSFVVDLIGWEPPA